MNRKPLIIGDLTAKLPIIQGGMGVGISLSGLAGAVAANGGIGIISTAQIGYREADFEEHPLEANLRAIGQELKKARKIAEGGIVGCNIMVATKHYAEYVKAAVQAGADLIISGAGLPEKLPGLTTGSKTKIAPIISTEKAAKVILRLWDRKYKRIPDLIVIEGPKAGGHLGFRPEQLAEFTREKYEEEVKKILETVHRFAEKCRARIPVVLAGGIYDRADLDHALDLGVDGVQMGTRFVTTWECDADMAYKETYLACKKEDVRIVESPVGMPGRAINNAFLEKKKEKGIHGKCYQCLEHCNPAQTPYCITRALIHAAKGEVADGLLFCGENAWRAEKIEHVADIMRELSQDPV